jgi:5-methyltetrahydrofolate--homocysteine methyltransferase
MVIKEQSMSDILKEITQKLYEGEEKEVSRLVQEGLSTGLSPSVLLEEGLIAGMDKVGKDFKSGELFVPEVLIAARSMQAGMNILRPMLVGSNVASFGKIVLGTVKGDLHDIGKNLVKMMLEGAGFEIIDLGNNIPPQVFVEAVRTHHPAIVGMSALLTTTMPQMKETILALKTAGLRDSVKVIVGGAPVTEEYALQIGADAYGSDAAVAVDKARSLVTG